MATKINEITEMLDSLKIKWRDQAGDAITTSWATTHYRSPSGEDSLEITIRLLEDGELLVVRAPLVFHLDGRNDAAFLRVCATLQRKHKLARFELDSTDGEVAATVPLPIEDAELTEQQLNRCVRGLFRFLEDYYPALEKARTTGEIDAALLTVETDVVAERLASALTPDILEKALHLARARLSEKSSPSEPGATPSSKIPPVRSTGGTVT